MRKKYLINPKEGKKEEKKMEQVNTQKKMETKFLGVVTELGGYCHLLMEQMSYSEAPNDLSKFGVVHNQQA